MNQLQRMLVWLRRMSHSRGFGVQSPSAYRFIRYVISEHYPYYAYAELRSRHPYIDWLERKRLELYFRIANYRQADVMLDYSSDSNRLADYVARGSKRTQVVNMTKRNEPPSIVSIETEMFHAVQYVRICPIEGCEHFLDDVMCHSDANTIMVVEDIATSAVAKRLWQRIVADERVSVSYDLYYLGVAFFDVKRHKANYIVNF